MTDGVLYGFPFGGKYEFLILTLGYIYLRLYLKYSKKTIDNLPYYRRASRVYYPGGVFNIRFIYNRPLRPNFIGTVYMFIFRGLGSRRRRYT